MLEDNTSINRIVIRMPTRPEDPELWFTQVESQFALGGITDDERKFSLRTVQVGTKTSQRDTGHHHAFPLHGQICGHKEHADPTLDRYPGAADPSTSRKRRPGRSEAVTIPATSRFASRDLSIQ